MTQRKSLSEILGGDSQDTLAKTWGETEAASDYTPLPRGEYNAVVVSGELHTAKTGTPGYKLTLEVTDGEHKGRKIWLDLWLTPAAIPLTKRDLAKLDITELAQLEKAPPRMVCKVKLALRKDNDGAEYNRVISFEAIGPEQADPFAVPAEASK
jgi:hypothetical protein